MYTRKYALFLIFLFFTFVSIPSVKAQSQLIEYIDSTSTLKPLKQQVEALDSLKEVGLDSNGTAAAAWKFDNRFQQVQLPNYADTIEHNAKKNWVRAGTEWFMFQALPASFNRFITQDPYSYISVDNWIRHLSPNAWAWDDNVFGTNQIAHPYHGQLYFNAFRSNNFSFLESSIATLAGSFMWETAGETQQPSINDLINTTYGGIILGEMTHRLSQNILSRPTKSLAERQGKEVLAFLVNPVNGLNRLMDGRWGRVVKGAVVDSSKITAQIDMGIRRFDRENFDLFNKGKNDLYIRLGLVYSNDKIDNKKPFDDFYVNIEVSSDDTTFVNTVNVYASIYGKRVLNVLPGKHLGILSANYDYYHNEAFFYGAQSMNFNLFSEFHLGGRNQLKTSIGGGPVLLAAVPDPYLLFGKSRNYNYGPGLDIRGSGEISVWKRFKFGAEYHGGYFVTISGNKSHYFLHTTSVSGSLRIMKNFSINMNSGFFTLQGNFESYPDIDFRYPFARLSIGYNVLF